MSVNTAPVGRLRQPEIASVIALAVVAALTLAVLALVDAARTGTYEQAPAPAAQDVPTPEWLQRYLELEAPATNAMPTPEWLKGYLDFRAPEGDRPTVPVETRRPSRPVDGGLH